MVDLLHAPVDAAGPDDAADLCGEELAHGVVKPGPFAPVLPVDREVVGNPRPIVPELVVEDPVGRLVNMADEIDKILLNSSHQRIK